MYENINTFGGGGKMKNETEVNEWTTNTRINIINFEDLLEAWVKKTT